MNYAKAIREFVVANFLFGSEGELRDDSSFLDSGVVDSTGILELIMFLEQTYGITIEPDEIRPSNLDSVEKVSAFLMRKLSAGGEGVASTVSSEQ